MFKVNNKNHRLCSSDFIIVNFEHISHLDVVLVFLLLTLNIFPLLTLNKNAFKVFVNCRKEVVT